MAGLPPGEFPVLAANRGQLADAVFSLRWHGGERPLDASFEWAVEAWISGLARQLESLDTGSPAAHS